MQYQIYGDITKVRQVIIMSHGFLAHQIGEKDYGDLIDKLVTKHCAVISFQYDGMGKDKDNVHHYSVSHWQQQLLASYQWVEQNYSQCQIHLLGVSFGNWLIASLIVQQKIKPVSTIAIAPVYSNYMSMITGGAIRAKQQQHYQLHGIAVHPSLIDALIYQSPIYYLDNYQVPTCLLWGDLDKVWRYSDCYLMYHHLLDQNVLTEFMTVKNGEHTLKNSYDVITQVEQLIMTWLAKF